MSPEADKPSAQTQAGSDKFVEGHHPVERVRPFKDGDLPDVHEELLERGIPDTVPIDPETLEVPVDKIPLAPATETETETETPHGKSKRGLLIGIGSAAAGAAIAITTFFGFSGHGDEAPKAQPTASATPNPGEGTNTGTQGEGEAPGNSTGNEKEPTPEAPTGTEVIAPVDKYPTAAEAIVPLVAQIEAYQNYYGTTKNLTSNPLSEEQKAEHEAMLESVFGPHYTDETVSGFITNLKESWPEILGYKTLTQTAIDAGYGNEEKLFTLKSTVTDVAQIGADRVKFTVLHDANFEENSVEENLDPAYAASIEEPLQVTAILEQVDGAWYIADWQTA